MRYYKVCMLKNIEFFKSILILFIFYFICIMLKKVSNNDIKGGKNDFKILIVVPPLSSL